MLRNVKGYDEYNTILLPPRPPGEKLPKEVTESYLEQQSKKEEEEKAQADAAARLQAEREAAETGEGTAAPDIATVPPTPGLADNGSETAGNTFSFTDLVKSNALSDLSLLFGTIRRHPNKTLGLLANLLICTKYDFRWLEQLCDLPFDQCTTNHFLNTND